MTPHWTLTRDTANGLDFTTPNYFDGQGFMVSKKLGVKSAKALDGATASDVRELIGRVRDEVMAHSGVLLQTEIKFVGFSQEWA